MIKRVNFTGRRRVPRDCVKITVHTSQDGQPSSFDAEINLDGLEFLPAAAVYIEATCPGSSVVERFPFGRVDQIEPPENRSLLEVDGDNVFFSLKVVDCTERFGRLLGVANHIHPDGVGTETTTGRKGILPILPADLGQEVWRLDLDGNDATLLVNNEIPGLADRLRSDPLLYSVLFPTVVRTVLRAAINENVDFEEDDDRWPVLWLRFGKEVHPERQRPPKPDASEECDEWIDEIVDAFCSAQSFKDRFSEAIGTSEGES